MVGQRGRSKSPGFRDVGTEPPNLPWRHNLQRRKGTIRTKQTTTGILLVLCAVFALTLGATTANAGGGNSANAKLCHKGGWQNLFTATGGSFAGEQACVSYAAQGGTLTTTPPSSTRRSAKTGEDTSTQVGWSGTAPLGPLRVLVRPPGMPSSWSATGLPD